jgi:hypothetical protein
MLVTGTNIPVDTTISKTRKAAIAIEINSVDSAGSATIEA